MVELRIELPTVVTVLASPEACDGVGAPSGASLLRVAPDEVMLIGADADGRRRPASPPRSSSTSPTAGWRSWSTATMRRTRSPRLSELALPSEGSSRARSRDCRVKVFVEPDRVTLLVPAMLATTSRNASAPTRA